MRSLRLLTTCMAACLLMGSRGGCGGGENAYIMSQMHLVTTKTDEQGPSGFSCSDVSTGSGGTGMGSITDEFWMSEESSEAGLSVKVGSFEQTLEQRFYDRAFIAAHQVDRFLVTTPGGAQYAFVYWGSDSCESCPPQPFEPLPGDPFGCESSSAVAP
jgi:hypothetical protein